MTMTAQTSPAAGRPRRANRLTVRVRPLRHGDAPLLADIFARLGPTSRFARFLTAKRHLTTAELRRFTEVDHHDHEAVIALTRLRGEALGVARFIRDADDPTSAEVAAEVVDEWQNRGVGSLLATRLAARARRENVTQLTALMLSSNHRAADLLAKAGTVTHVIRDGTTVSYRVTLPGRAQASRPRLGHSSTALEPLGGT